MSLLRILGRRGGPRFLTTMLAPGATPGDVLTVQEDGSVEPAAPGEGGGSQPVTHEAFSGLGLTVADGDTAPLKWEHSAGDVLVDLTDPQLPVVLTAGVYGVSVSAYGANLTAGGFFGLTLEFDYNDLDQSVGTHSRQAGTGDDASPQVALSLTYYLPANAVIAASAWNRDGVSSRVFTIGHAYIQRIA